MAPAPARRSHQQNRRHPGWQRSFRRPGPAMALGQAGISRQAGVLLHHQQRPGADARRGRGYPDQTRVYLIQGFLVSVLL